ncbi:MAG: sialate O-acetylesterase [Bacteroidales bacterium]|nr:sialate O-acetylesterase [Bacteroidales bacterium]
MKRFIGLCLLVLLSKTLSAKVVLPDILSDYAVLQQQTEVRLWGKSTPNSLIHITPSWNNRTVTTRSDAEGKWQARVNTPTAGFTPYSIDFFDGDTTRIQHILIGEVWFCSGQSNMEMPLNGFWNCPVENANETIATSGEWTGIRMATIPKTGAPVPQENVAGCWKESNPFNAPYFSATAFSFARMLSRVLQIPVGIISCAWGGSRVEGWLPEEIVKTYPDVDLGKEIKTPEEGEEWNYHTPTIMYNGMLKPLQSYTIRGFLWYQGESNVGKETTYAERLRTMVELWRKEWNQGELPFYLVEIAPYDYGEGIGGALLREAQSRAAALIPNSGMVCTNDLAYPYEKPQIHPCQKEEVGKRLAYLALNKTYNYWSIACDYPTYRSMSIQKDTVELTFDHADEGFSPWTGIEGFEVAGEDRIFHPAEASLDTGKKTIRVCSDKVKHPAAVRYCFRNFQPGNLKNHRGMPVVPFRTDQW